MLAVAERVDLAECVQSWMQRQRLEKAELARLSGIGRNTLYRILEGMPAQPDTLRKIAKGVATDPHSGEVDAAVRQDVLKDFSDATGFDLIDLAPPPSLEAAIRSEGVRSPRQAAKLAAFLRKYPNMTPNQRKLVDALIDNIE